MRDYADIPAHRIDATILDRISEHEVNLWLAAWLTEARKETPSISAVHLQLSKNLRGDDDGCYSNFTVFASGLVGASSHLADALTTLREKLNNNPAEQAAEKRREAERLMKQAADLERVAAGLGLATTKPKPAPDPDDDLVAMQYAA